MVSDRVMGVAAAILAGGLARRMGGLNKAALRIGAERIVDRQLRVLRQIADPVFIVAADPEPFAGLGVEVVPDAIEGAGPLGGIYTALTASPCEWTIVVACDLPYLSEPLLRRLAQPTDADLIIPRTERGYEPLCAAWSKRCADAIKQRIQSGNLKAALVVEELRAELIEPPALEACDPHGLLFVNINTPHDYERAQRLGRMESKSLRDRIMDVS
jgi:molybdopterin-guanine dinucleotide biosynthesis protein A